MSIRPREIVVVGAGIGGLAAAIRLAAQGHRVRVLERQAQVGGKLNRVTMQGFSFDTGPSLITMPAVLHDLFQSAGRRLEDYLELVPLDLTCRYFYRDGLIFNAWRDRRRLAAECAHLNAHDGPALYTFLEHAYAIYQAAADPFLYHSLGSPLDVMRTFIHYVLRGHAGAMIERDELVDKQTQAGGAVKEMRAPLDDALSLKQRSIIKLARLRAVLAALSPRTLDECVRANFEDEHLCQLFDRYATYNGSSPYQLASVYSIIPYVEMADGGWYPRGGVYALAEAMERLARDLGVVIETNCEVKRILVERNEARGIVLADGRILRSDIVIANSDVVTTYRELLAHTDWNKRYVHHLEHLEPSCSGFVLLLGVNKRYPQLAHHNIFFSDDYRGEFEDLFTKRVPLHNPTIYICATTRTDTSQAPPGHENLFILVNAPYLTQQSDWQRDAPAYRTRILDLLARYKQIELSDLREHIVCEEMITPEDFQQRYGANAGAIYGLSSNQRMAPFSRPGNRAKGIRNLYFVGGSTHPGGGVPLVMLSGKIVSELIERGNQ